MRYALVVGILSVGLPLLAPVTRAQELGSSRNPRAVASERSGPCGAWSLSALRGTYAFTATAWQDLSQINPALPGGYAPVTIIGTFVVNGNGDLTGSAHVNAGGLRMAAEFVDSRLGAPRPDCSFPMSLSMKIDDFGGAVTGPYAYEGVIASDRPLEIAFMMLGAGPGSHVELDHARRISTRTN